MIIQHHADSTIVGDSSVPNILSGEQLFSGIYNTTLHRKRAAVRVCLTLLTIAFLSIGGFAQTPGLIYKPAGSVAGKAVLDPDGNGYTSATTSGFSGSDYGTSSELKLIAIPQLETEPSGDLATGGAGGHTDMVDAGVNRKSVFVMSNGTNLIIRFRIGNASTASKGYSLLIDTDNSFSGSGTNPGFEQEIVLETGTNGRIAVYNHDPSAGTSLLSASYNINDYHQRSIAITTNNGDADYFYDFYVPLSAISGSPVRFAAATITSAGSGITGTISDVNGVNDLAYNSNVSAMLTAVVSAFPSTTLSTLTEGATFAAVQTSAPYISSTLLTTSTSVSGTSSEVNGTTVTVYKNGNSIGSASVSGNAWSLSGIAGGTFAGGDIITAKAQDNAAGKTVSAVSNTVIIGQICTNIPIITTVISGNKGFTGTWTPTSGTIAGSTVRIYVHVIPNVSGTIGSTAVTAGQETILTTDYTGAAIYASTTSTNGAAGTWRFEFSNTGNSVPAGTYWATAIITGGCESNASTLTYVTVSATATPIITTTSPNNTATQITGTRVSNAKIYLYVNGAERTVVAAAASTSWTASGLTLVAGDILTAKAIVAGTSGLSDFSDPVTVISSISGTSNAPVITGTYNNTTTSITGTSTEAAGTTITIYKNSNSIGTATVTIFHTWTLGSVTLATNDKLTAKATASGKNQSAASAEITVLGPTTSIPAVTSPIFANSASIGGTNASGILKVYIDGEPLSPSLSAQSGGWNYTTAQLSSLASELYAGASVTATNTESGKLESTKSAGVTVVGVNNFLVEKATGGNIGTQTAGIAFPVKITARDASNNTFTTYTGTNILSSGSTISAGSGPTSSFVSGVLTSHNITLTKAGSYSLTTVGSDAPAITGSSNTFIISAANPNKLEIFQQPSVTATSEVTIPQQPKIYVYDEYGNHVTSDNTTQVTASIATGTGGTLNGVKTLTAVNGIVTFSGLNLQGSGAYTLSFAASGLTSITSGTITVTASTPAAPTNLSYTTPNSYNTGEAITLLTPTVTGTVSSYGISPALPAGLALNNGTGVISGTPTIASSQADYTVTATNSTGSTTFVIRITVTGGAAPIASVVAISGTTTVGQTLTGSYTYSDADSDAQGTSTFRWLSSATANGTYAAISGATASTYVLTSGDQGKFLKFEVTPVAASGTPLTGTAVLSSATSAISGRAPVASAVAISGTTTVGQTLTGSYTYSDADSDSQGTSTFRWLSSATANGTYAAISSATASTYVLTSGDQGKFLKFEVTPVAATGTPLTGIAVLSSATSAIAGRAPVATLVAITGTEIVGQTLTGSYTYSDADSDAQGTSTFRWLSSDAANGTYAAISGATASTYVLTSGDQGKFFKFEVTPVAATGTPLTGTEVLSSATSAIGGRAPVATLAAITGTETVSQTLTGSYTYSDADSDLQGTSTFRWLSSTTSGGTYTAISGATASTYVLTSGDQGKYIKFEVTPVAATGTPLTGTAELSSATSAIAGRAPVATLVSISGTETVGQTLTGSYSYSDADGDSQGTSTIRWLSSATANGTYAAISGATASTYVLTSGDQGKFFKFEVTPVAATGTPSTGTAVLSSATSQITGGAPIAIAVAISGTTTVGQTLTGSFTYSDADSDAQGTSTFRWLSSATANGTYAAISGATASTYVLTSGDQGKYIKFEVTPVAATGTPLTGTAELSSATSAIAGRAPVATLVAITGTEIVGQTLTGSYTYSDADSDAQGTSTFRWLSSATANGTYSAISGATASTYVLTSGDQGKFLKFEVTPVAATGTPLTGTEVLSSATSAIGGRAPVASAVAISGTTTVGQTLTGSYTYSDADSDAQGTSTFRWLSSATANGTYAAISSATASTYVLTSGDQGKFLKFEVTPVAATGTPLTGITVLSSATSAIAGRAPVASVVAISGTTTVGQTLNGSYTYSDADSDAQGTSTFRWLSSATANGTYAAISGAAASTYVLTSGDQGKFLKFEVTPVAATGTPLTGTAELSSATSAIAGRAPVATLAAITGTETVGQTLTGSFTYTDADSDLQGTSTFRWLASDSANGTYAAISGATALTYVLTSGDQGKFLKFEVTPVAATGTPLTGTAVLSSATSAIGGRAPVASAVAFSGTTTVGQTLTGSYTYSDADGDAQGTSTFRWLSSATANGTYAAISGAAASTYVLTSGDQGKYIKFEVTPVAATGTPLTGTAVLSSATSQITGGAPIASVVAISGTTTVGQTLTGSYTYSDADSDLQGPSTFRWLSSTTSGGTYTAISGATASTYFLTSSDQGKFLKFEVTPVAATGTPLTGTAVLSSATSAIQTDIHAPVISFNTPNIFTKGSAITALTPVSTGDAVVSYSISPALSPGLSLSTTTGIISGTPTSITGPITYTITAANTGGSSTFNVLITVFDAAPIISYSSPKVYTKGLAISPLIPATTGGIVVNYSVSPGLPTGLSLNTTTGVISGTPTNISEQGTFKVTASNSGGVSTFNVLITVNDAAPVITYSSPKIFTKETAITALSPVSTGGAVVSYNISPALPSGLNFNNITGIISGIPTNITGQGTYAVTAINTGGTSTFNIVITVNDSAPVITYNATNIFIKSSPITELTPVSTGGAVTAYNISPALPAGLMFNSTTGIISGTPIILMSQSTYTITATNSAGSTSVTISITINDAAPIIAYFSPNTYTKGVPITSLPPVNTGGAVVSYSVSPALPAGLSLNLTTGVISGTPAIVAAQNTYIITAMNSGGSMSNNVLITVKDSQPDVSYSMPAIFVQGTPGTIAPSVSGGTPVSYEITPALPAGLNLNTSTGVISGAPANISEPTSYTVIVKNTGGTDSFQFPITVNKAVPKIEVLLNASVPLKQTDGSFNVDYRVKVSNVGNTILSNLELSVDLSQVFPAPVEFRLIRSPNVSGGDVIPNNKFNGTGNINLISGMKNQREGIRSAGSASPLYIASDNSIDDLTFIWNKKRDMYKQLISVPSGSNAAFSLVGTNSGLALKDTALVTFTLNIKPNGNFGPYAMNVLGTGQSQSGEVVSEVSTDGQFVSNSALTGTRYPTIVSIFPNPQMGSSLNVQQVTRINDNSYDVKFSAKLKNSGNIVLNKVKLIADLKSQFKSADFAIKSLNLINGQGLITDNLFDGKLNNNILLPVSAVNVGSENTIDFTVNINPNGVYGNYSLQLRAEAFASDADQTISNISYDGTEPDKSLANTLTNKASIFIIPFPGPQNLAIDNSSINENNEIDALIGTVKADDANPAAILSYSLVSGTGDSDNAKFKISGSRLLAAQTFNYEQKSTFSIRVRAADQFGLSDEKNLMITVNDINEQPALDIVPEQQIFYTTAPQTINLTNLTAGPETSQQVTVEINTDNSSLFDQLKISGNQILYKIKAGQTGVANVILIVTDNGGVQNGGVNQLIRDFKLTIDALPVITASPDTISKGFSSNLLVSTPVPSTYKWSAIAGLSNTAIVNPVARPGKTTTYEVLVTNQFGNSVLLFTTVAVTEDYKIMIPNVFTPNGDGVNDNWEIENIASYPDHVLTLFDRSGRILQQVRNYQNDWNGTANGQPLEEGTYYYNLRFEDKSAGTKTGFITIVR